MTLTQNIVQTPAATAAKTPVNTCTQQQSGTKSLKTTAKQAKTQSQNNVQQVSKQTSEAPRQHARSTDNHATARPSLAAASKKRMNLKKGKMQKSQIV